MLTHHSLSLRVSCAAMTLCVGALLASCGGGAGGSSSSNVPSNLSYSSPQSLTLDTAISAISPNVAGASLTYSVDPPLPAGLSLNNTTGQITGTPTVTSATAAYRITATNSNGSTSFDLNLGIQYTQPFWVEPARSTVIGIGQTLSLYGAYKANASDAYPSYLNSTAVTWISSNPGCASINSNGRVTGISACNTTITASYNGRTVQIPIQVSGNWVTRTVTVAGQGTRNYSVYVPDFGSIAGPHPTMLSLHGGGGSALIQASTSQLVKLASTQKIYIAFLEGSGLVATFNAGACCGYARTNNIDDVAYTRAVLDDLQATYSVDTTQVYATGMSNGGMMAHRLACEMSDRLSGIAAVSGASAQFDQNLTQYYNCTPARRIPVLHIHAANDRNYPFAGGTGDGASATAYYPVDSTITDWRTRNNVTNVATVTRVTATTTCYRYATAANINLSHAPVTLCKIDPFDVFDGVNDIVFGGGHSWPGGTRSPSSTSDTPIMDFVANDYIWSFFNP